MKKSDYKLIRDYYSKYFKNAFEISMSYSYLFGDVNNSLFSTEFQIFIKGDILPYLKSFHSYEDAKIYLRENYKEICKIFDCQPSDFHLVRFNSYFVDNHMHYKQGYIILW